MSNFFLPLHFPIKTKISYTNQRIGGEKNEKLEIRASKVANKIVYRLGNSMRKFVSLNGPYFHAVKSVA